jgi:DNA helicase HerA-like ATPase
MKLGPTDVTVIFGQRGSGKSTLGRRLAEIYPHLVVFDPLGEWKSEKVFSSFDEFRRLWLAHYADSEFTLVFHRKPGMDLEFAASEFSRCVSAVYSTGFEQRKLDGELPASHGLCLVLEEVQFLAPLHALDPWLAESVFTGRHAGLAIIASTQRPASVHKSLVSQASNVFVGRLFEYRDVRYLEDCIGEIARRASSLPLFKFIWVKPGEGAELVSVSQ